MKTHHQSTAAKYKELRSSIGSQRTIAKKLDVTEITLSRRENGHVTITPEMMLALAKLKEDQSHD